MPNANSCWCGASAVSCCKMLQVFVVDNFFRCLHSFFYGSCCFLRILYFDLRCENPLVCQPNSSQDESCGWLQLGDSIQFVQNPVKLDLNPQQLVCKYPKTYFRVIPLFLWIVKIYSFNLVQGLNVGSGVGIRTGHEEETVEHMLFLTYYVCM